jgi:two-component system phosphate regulon sensor histidine kinase PhoR
MNEGLILLNGDNAVLSINPAAARLFGAGEDCVGQDMFSLDRSLAMQELVGAARRGARAERVMQLGGGSYQLIANPVRTAGKAAGVALLAFDVTEKARAEQLRREFSANVSHELKTPLHAILGSAELIENGMVKSEDIPRFAGRVRAEAARLVALIEDIIRLSQLDEGAALPREEVALKTLAEEAAQALEEEAKGRNITVAIGGENIRVVGAKRLLYEIAYNLIDNAVKYNGENGRVDVVVRREAGGASLVVSDTGIGIPREHQSRVFERFYRVDKSHSKQTGGTGLGLSIVKHAAQAHNASVSLASTPGRGTRVAVWFPDTAE